MKYNKNLTNRMDYFRYLQVYHPQYACRLNDVEYVVISSQNDNVSEYKIYMLVDRPADMPSIGIVDTFTFVKSQYSMEKRHEKRIKTLGDDDHKDFVKTIDKLKKQKQLNKHSKKTLDI